MAGSTGDPLLARAAGLAALGEPHRLRIVDLLRVTDLTPKDLQARTGLSSNLLAFHLDVLERADLIVRTRSEGDARRRYVGLRAETLDALIPAPPTPLPEARGPVVFVCSRNAARSQLAAALWRARTGREARSAGSRPAAAVDPHAVAVARARGLDVAGWRPAGYDAVDVTPALVVSVCDRAGESGTPWSAPTLHWSVPDPHGGGRDVYEATLDDLDARVARLAAGIPAPVGAA